MKTNIVLYISIYIYSYIYISISISEKAHDKYLQAISLKKIDRNHKSQFSYVAISTVMADL